MPLEAEEALFLAEHRHERIVIDPGLRLIVLNYLSPSPDSLMVKEPVPPGVDIFSMMNLTVPRNVSRLDGWAIMIHPNSSMYTRLLSAIGVSKEVVLHVLQKKEQEKGLAPNVLQRRGGKGMAIYYSEVLYPL